jgi:hypothetical protein
MCLQKQKKGLELVSVLFYGTLEASVEVGFMVDVGESPSMNFSSGGPTSWSLVGPGVEVGLKLSFIDYVRFSLSSRVVLLLQH